jgi:hypothetical protein
MVARVAPTRDRDSGRAGRTGRPCRRKGSRGPASAAGYSPLRLLNHAIECRGLGREVQLPIAALRHPADDHRLDDLIALPLAEAAHPGRSPELARPTIARSLRSAVIAELFTPE